MATILPYTILSTGTLMPLSLTCVCSVQLNALTLGRAFQGSFVSASPIPEGAESETKRI